MTSTIPTLTPEELERIGRAANTPGRLAKSWAQLTRLLRDRLQPGMSPKPRARRRLYRDQSHYLVFQSAASGELQIEFGRMGPSGEQVRIGCLKARWDELGLTGPYDITFRGREHTLNTFCVVLEHYLGLPEVS